MSRPARPSPPSPKRTAMVLAAGLGLRMMPLTANTPKPLLEVAGKPLIEYAMERLRAAEVRLAVVNVHYLADQVERWAVRQPAPPIVISDERQELLDTGGGIARALPKLGSQPFFVINSDSFWLDGPTPALTRLERVWDGKEMDSLLLLAPKTAAVGYTGPGDFDTDADGRLARRPTGSSARYVYAGCYLVAPELFMDAPRGKFSMNVLWDRAAAKGRLYGLVHDCGWIHVGSPAAIAQAETALQSWRQARA